MHPEDAAARGIEENSIVKVFNGRGALLAGVHLTQDILPGVVQMSTGAWYDPLDQQEGQPLDKHGNPNVLTQDSGSSRLGQGAVRRPVLSRLRFINSLCLRLRHGYRRHSWRGAQSNLRV